MSKNLLIAHGGGPTAVINASLYGALKELKDSKFDGKIYAPRFGSDGLVNEDFVDLTNISEEDLELLKTTPGSAIGSSRFPLYDKEYEQIIDVLIKYDIGYVLFTGGNGSMDTIGNIYKHALKRKYDVTCVGIPKTVDNDLGITDHAPGYASCANYIIQSVKDACNDVKGFPIHVCVIELMGRNAGWLTAASALARDKEGSAPHLIYLPEVPFDEDKFIEDVKREWDKHHGGVVVCCSEGLKDKDGKPIVKPIYKTERATYFGDVSTHLATLVIQRLGIKARSEKPGLLQRCSSTLTSKVDVDEAVLCGKEAIKAALAHKNGVMVGIKRISSNPYKIETILIPIDEVMMKERTFPLSYIKNGNDVSDEFVEWLKPLVNEPKKTISFVDKD